MDPVGRSIIGFHIPISLLSPERAALSETGLTTCWLAKNGGTGSTDDDGLGMRENSGDIKAAGALDVHEEGTRSWNKSLELMLSGLSSRGRVKEIFR